MEAYIIALKIHARIDTRIAATVKYSAAFSALGAVLSDFFSPPCLLGSGMSRIPRCFNSATDVVVA
jgi:hypothetical protein